MNIARIVSITPDGKPFTTANGTFYPFLVAFDDHHSGQANSKSQQPPYKVGEVCGYDVTGQTPRGMDKFKITRNPDPSAGKFTGQPEAEHMPGDPAPVPPAKARSVAQTPRSEPSSLPVNLPHGATVGCAYNNAVKIWLDTAGKEGARWDASARELVTMWAADILSDLQALEQGHKPSNEPF